MSSCLRRLRTVQDLVFFGDFKAWSASCIQQRNSSSRQVQPSFHDDTQQESYDVGHLRASPCHLALTAFIVQETKQESRFPLKSAAVFSVMLFSVLTVALGIYSSAASQEMRVDIGYNYEAPTFFFLTLTIFDISSLHFLPLGGGRVTQRWLHSFSTQCRSCRIFYGCCTSPQYLNLLSLVKARKLSQFGTLSGSARLHSSRFYWGRLVASDPPQ